MEIVTVGIPICGNCLWLEWSYMTAAPWESFPDGCCQSWRCPGRNCSGWKLTGVWVMQWWLFHHKFHMVEFPWMANVLGWHLSEFHTSAWHSQFPLYQLYHSTLSCDTTLFLSHLSYPHIISYFNDDLIKIENYMISIRLSINADKKTAIMFSNKPD